MTADMVIDAITEAAFGEFNHHMEIYQRTTDLDNYLRLMDPNYFVQFVANASVSLSDIGMIIINQLYELHYITMPMEDRFSLNPSFEMQKDFKNNLLTGINKLQMDIDHYGTIYYSSVEKINNARHRAGSLGGAAIGGAIGCLFGPVGAFLGGLAGTALADESAKDEANVAAQLLKNEFIRIYNLTNSYLETMGNDTITFFMNYERIVSGKNNYVA